MQSHYLFHPQSAVARGTTTEQQRAAMNNDPAMSQEILQAREQTIGQEKARQQQTEQEYSTAQAQRQQRQQQVAAEQEQALRRQAEVDQQAALGQSQQQTPPPTTPHPIYDTIGGRNASMERTAFGDQDSQSERFPEHRQDPMISRAPGKRSEEGVLASETEIDSPWRATTRSQPLAGDQEDQVAEQQRTRRAPEEQQSTLRGEDTPSSAQEDNEDTASF